MGDKPKGAQAEGKKFVRFSTPGGRGFVEGTSKEKFRADWIEIRNFTFYELDSLARTAVGRGDRTAQGVAFLREVDNSSYPLFKFATTGQSIDKVAIEIASPEGITIAPFSWTEAWVENVEANGPEDVERLEVVRLSAEKFEVSVFSGVLGPLHRLALQIAGR